MRYYGFSFYKNLFTEGQKRRKLTDFAMVTNVRNRKLIIIMGKWDVSLISNTGADDRIGRKSFSISSSDHLSNLTSFKKKLGRKTSILLY